MQADSFHKIHNNETGEALRSRVNIYMPTYEPNPDYLHAAIDAVKNQTFSEWTLLINDDASYANVKDYIFAYLNDPRITFNQNTVRQGIGGNWNACLLHGNAPYMQYMFQDDLWEPQYLETMIRVLDENPDVGFASAAHKYLNEEGIASEGYAHVLRSRKELQPGKQGGIEFLHAWIMQGLHPNLIGEPPFVMMRREIMEKAGKFSEELKQDLDSEYWMRLLLHGNWYYVPEDLGTFRVHGEGASAKNEQSGAGMFDRLLIFSVLKKLLPPEQRTDLGQALDTHIDNMAQKFLKRTQTPSTGKKRSTLGPLLSFAIFHPIILGNAGLRWVMNKLKAKK